MILARKRLETDNSGKVKLAPKRTYECRTPVSKMKCIAKQKRSVEHNQQKKGARNRRRVSGNKSFLDGSFESSRKPVHVIVQNPNLLLILRLWILSSQQ